MKKIFALLVLACAIFVVNADEIPGNQELKKDSRIVTEFQQVVVNADFNISITYAISPKVEVEAESNLHQYIITEVKGKTLNISVAKKTRLAPNYPINITLCASALNKIQFNGNGDVTADGIPSDKMELILSGKGICTVNNLKTNSLKITAGNDFTVNMKDVISNGAAKIALSDNVSGNIGNLTAPKIDIESASLGSTRWASVQTDALNLNVTAAGNMTFTGFAGKDVKTTMNSTGTVDMSGTTRNVDVTLSNAANFDALALTCEKAKVVNNGTGDAGVNATSNLDVTITSAGNISFKGDLKISYTNTGSGQLIKKK